MKSACIWICCVLSLFITQVYSVAVMSVDLGTEWMKVAIVSPGVPMEIALNHESQRKTPVIVAFRDNERYLGESASTIRVRFPDKAYSHFLELLGKKADSPIVQLFKRNFPYYNITTHEKRGTVILHHPDNMSFLPEELVAMILRHAQEIATSAAGQPVKDAVITVPPYFNQAERRAVLQAADLAGIKVLQIINSNTAVALNYGVFRRKDFNETPSNILFFDMGAGNTIATIASYQMVKTKDKGYAETNPVVTIKGVGFDRTLGGLAMQLKLQHYLAESFNKQKKTSQDVFQNNRAMAKLLKEAGRLQKVLSANSDHIAQDEIDQVILAGAATRTPRVQQKLLEIVKKPELGKNINTDEAAALGAAYQAAYLSKGFKVKTFVVKDANIYPIQVDFQREIDSEDGTPKTKLVKRILFSKNNPFPQKKIMTFNRHTKDFSFNVSYADLNFLPQLEYQSVGSHNLSVVSLSGVQDAMSKHVGEDSESKGVKVHFHLDENGILKIDHAESIFEKKLEDETSDETTVESTLSKLGNTIGKLFSTDSSKADNKEEASDESQSVNNETSDDSNINKNASESTKNETQDKVDKKGPKIITIKENVVVNYLLGDFHDMEEAETIESLAKLKKIDDQEREKLAQEKAKNALESFILETKNKLYTEEYEKAAAKEEIEKILSKLSEEGDWLEYESGEAKTEVFKEKLSELKSLTKELFKRVQEHKDRPDAINALNDMINISTIFLKNAQKVPKEEQIFTDVEITTLEKLISETEQWKNNSVKEQENTPLYENPKLTIKSIAEKIAALDREVKYLLNKARFAVPKTKQTEESNKDTSKNNTQTNETESTEETQSDIESEKEMEPNEKENIPENLQMEENVADITGKLILYFSAYNLITLMTQCNVALDV
ncbi:hypoxia up-regulated protein 1-like [Centruroides sculpturatus]|uniref:hypoxia up-regulated protein 1-like n=1 Tax=Centruroides sculpturatus TaxID=218467 RepID=UPI000C6CAA00|nr:hypoxia up-regulated protein 1-like [Centruroides sculpturatus]